VSSTRVSGQNEELAILDMEYLRLRCYFGILGCLRCRIVVQRERHDKFSRILGCAWDGDIVLDETGLPLSLLVGAPFLVECCLHENIQGVATSGDCQALKAMVVVTSGGVIRWKYIIAGTLIIVERGRIGRERLRSIAHRNHGINRSNRCNQ
jgi:hypothetical protein